MKKILFFMAVYAACTAFLFTSPGGVLILPDSLTEEKDPEWIEEFSNQFSELISGSRVLERSISIAFNTLNPSRIPQEPEAAAYSYYNAILYTDRSLRQGTSVAHIKVRIKHLFEIEQEAAEKVKDDKGLKVVKDKPAKILKDKEEKDKLDKTPKPEKTPKPPKTPKP